MLFSDANALHSSWLTERNATATFAPTRETYQQALKVGFDPERLHLVGWPVRAQFYGTNGPTRAETLTRLKLDPDCFTLFLQGGGEGAAKFVRTVESVLAASSELQVILAVGTNQALLEHFKGVKNVYTLPFTKEIAQYMVAADVVMGKAGPNTLFESVMLGKPFIATAYIPGQEEANLEFIRQYQLGWVVLDPEKQCELVARLTTTRTELSAMTAGAQAYRQWNSVANESLIPLIHSLLPGQ
jgi:1,2-diacylglycerol 3-beta-galactosyltransferase